MFKNTGAKGAWAELLVCADLLNRGYEVFRSVSLNCSCDVVALLDGKLLRVEVRSAHLKRRNTWCCLPPQDGKYDTLAMVLESGEIHYYPPIDGEQPTVRFRTASMFVVLAH